MEDSRLSRFGRSIIHNNSNIMLLQQLNAQNYYNDKPIKNTSTAFLDENGKQKQITFIKNYLSKPKNIQSQTKPQTIPKKLSNFIQKQQYSSSISKDRSQKNSLSKKNYNQQQSNDSKYLLNRIHYQKKNQKRKKLLTLTTKRNQYKFQDIDFIGGNLYQIQDIVGDIDSIVQKTKKKTIFPTYYKHRPDPLKNNIWFNNNNHDFGQLNRLDYMLQNYKTIPDIQPINPIPQDYYNQLKSSTSSSVLQQIPIKNKNKNKNSIFRFPSRIKSNKENKFTILITKWTQMPMIGTKWQPSIYLKMQSFPQQQQYRQIYLKACQLNIKSYSIFNYHDAGLTKIDIKNPSLDLPTYKLKSQQQYAKTWQQQLINNTLLTQQQKQLLMEFDIEWYRTFIEFCYHTTLEDLLERQHDVTIYTLLMNSLQRYQHINGSIIIQNQITYLKEYFQKVYPYTSQQITLAAIRITNTDKQSIEQIYQNFHKYLNNNPPTINTIHNTSQTTNDNIQLCIWPLKDDNSALLVLFQLCGRKNKQCIELNKYKKNIKIYLKDFNQYIDIVQYNERLKQNKTTQHKNNKQNQLTQITIQQQHQNIPTTSKIIIKSVQENNWQLYMKLENDKNCQSEFKINMNQQLLFGTLYHVQFNK